VADGLLLLHAFPMDASMWSPQVDSLGGDVPVVAPNFPGFGGAAAGGPVMEMDAAADAGIAALDAEGLEGAVVCGLSMGGYAALALWRRHPQRVRGLILANTRSGADDDTGRERRLALAERLRAEGSAFMVESPPPLLSADAPAGLWDRVKGIIAAQPAEAIAAASAGMASRPDSGPDLPGIGVPVLVVTSTGDTLIPPEATTPMADQIPGASLEVIQDAGHLSNLEAPEAFTDLVRSHLRRSGL
jgi:pimeloyl-ACP methyl ester carboxylesterase